MGETMSSRVIDGISRLEGEQWECDLWVSGMIRRAAKMDGARRYTVVWGYQVGTIWDAEQDLDLSSVER